MRKREGDSMFSAEQVLTQLGGNRFIAMTGAKNFVKSENDNFIAFKIGRNSKGINYVRIRLNSMDLYDMEFISIRAGVIKIKSTAENIYNDMLETAFTNHTGLYTRL
jgi:hypothetical protein